jgi:hypothetical protein
VRYSHHTSDVEGRLLSFEDTLTETTLNLSATVTDDAGDPAVVEITCDVDETGEIVAARRTVYTVNLRDAGSHEALDTPSFPTFAAAWAYFCEIEVADDAKDDGKSAASIRAIVERGDVYELRIGTRREAGRGFPVFARLARVEVGEPLVDVEQVAAENGRGRLAYSIDPAVFLVELVDEDGRVRPCDLDGEVISPSAPWTVVGRAPACVAKAFKEVWDS